MERGDFHGQERSTPGTGGCSLHIRGCDPGRGTSDIEWKRLHPRCDKGIRGLGAANILNNPLLSPQNNSPVIFRR